MIFRKRIIEEELIDTPTFWKPVIRRRVGYEIYYRWNCWGLFDIKLKTVWRKGFTEWEIKE